MPPVRIAVIGAGSISQVAFLPAVPQTGNAVIGAIVSGDAAKARKLADFYGVPDICSYDTFDALAQSGKIDAVYIATPNSSHCEHAVSAARHGLHALVEKPLATTAEDSRHMIAAAKAAGTILMTAYRLHNDPATIHLSELLSAGAIGEVRYVSSSFTYQAPFGDHRLDAAHWGGPLQDIGVYCLNAIRHIMRENPRRVSAVPTGPSADPRFSSVEEGLAVTMEFSNGRLAQFYAGFGAETMDSCQILGTSGSITFENAFRFEPSRRMILQQGQRRETIDFPKTDDFSGMIAYFADCILKGEQPLADGEEGLADMEAMLAIERACKDGRSHDVPAMPFAGTYRSQMRRSFPEATRKLIV